MRQDDPTIGKQVGGHPTTVEQVIEARITCVCPQIIVGDLGLKLTKGMVVYVGQAEARASGDLLRAARANGVTVQYVKRVDEIRPANGAAIARPRRVVTVASPIMVDEAPVLPVMQEAPQTSPVPVSAPLDSQAVKDAVAVHLAPLGAKLDALLQAMAAGGGSGVPVGSPITLNNPVFVPSNLGGGKNTISGSEFGTVESSAPVGDLGDAASALRRSRANKKKET